MTAKKESRQSRLNITIVMDLDGNLTAWSNLKNACKAYEFSYSTVTKKKSPITMPGGFTVYRLEIHYE